MEDYRIYSLTRGIFVTDNKNRIVARGFGLTDQERFLHRLVALPSEPEAPRYNFDCTPALLDIEDRVVVCKSSSVSNGPLTNLDPPIITRVRFVTSDVYNAALRTYRKRTEKYKIVMAEIYKFYQLRIDELKIQRDKEKKDVSVPKFIDDLLKD